MAAPLAVKATLPADGVANTCAVMFVACPWYSGGTTKATFEPVGVTATATAALAQALPQLNALFAGEYVATMLKVPVVVGVQLNVATEGIAPFNGTVGAMTAPFWMANRTDPTGPDWLPPWEATVAVRVTAWFTAAVAGAVSVVVVVAGLIVTVVGAPSGPFALFAVSWQLPTFTGIHDSTATPLLFRLSLSWPPVAQEAGENVTNTAFAPTPLGGFVVMVTGMGTPSVPVEATVIGPAAFAGPATATRRLATKAPTAPMTTVGRAMRTRRDEVSDKETPFMGRDAPSARNRDAKPAVGRSGGP